MAAKEAESTNTGAETEPSPKTELPVTQVHAASPNASLVEGPLSWLEDNPGSQLLTGSFHPVTDACWYDLAYPEASSLDEFVQTLCGAAFEGADPVLRTVLRRNRNQVETK